MNGDEALEELTRADERTDRLEQTIAELRTENARLRFERPPTCGGFILGETVEACTNKPMFCARHYDALTNAGHELARCFAAEVLKGWRFDGRLLDAMGYFGKLVDRRNIPEHDDTALIDTMDRERWTLYDKDGDAANCEGIPLRQALAEHCARWSIDIRRGTTE